MSTHFPVLSYRVDTTARNFKKPRMSAFQKCIVEIGNRMIPVFGRAHGLKVLTKTKPLQLPVAENKTL